MLDIILEILGVLGIVLLILLGVILVLLVLVLFWPVTYKVTGQKTAEALTVKVKLNWLLGLLRGRFLYPEPGNFVLKILWITLFDSASSKEDKADDTEAGTDTEATDTKNASGAGESVQNTEQENEGNKISSEEEDEEFLREILDEVLPETEQPKKGIKAFILSKYEKIKYTILKIYDKIKHIFENIIFYKELLQDEQTIGLLKHAKERILKILKNIRPRKLKADIVFGTGSPDTTGYVLAVYGMLSPMLGTKVNITPDFTQAVFYGDFYMAGHITIFQLLYHSLMILFDKRLKLLNTRIKRHRNKQN